jgi:membrane-bound lytic murein transglycosylase F
MRNNTQHIFLLVSAILLTFCGQNKKILPSGTVPGDLKNIIACDTLKVATMYGATSYFIFRDEMMGFDYEMATDLAKQLNVNLKIIVAKNENELVQLLQEGKVDVVCYNMIETKELKKQFKYVLPQSDCYQVIVQNVGVKPLSEITELAGESIYVKPNSIFHKRLKELNDEIGGTIKIIEAADSLSNEDLIDMVGDKEIKYTLAYHNIALIHKSFYKRLDCHMPVGFSQHNGWLVRIGSPELIHSIESWQNMPETKELQTELFDKYWDDSPYFILRKIKIPKGAISPYDRLFKKYASQISWDWRLLAALAFHESRFDASQISWAGAAGLMQLMPHTANTFGLNRHTVLDPEMNIEASVQYIKSLNLSFRKVENKNERIKFILASYNCGPSHIIDAMSLAKKYGKNSQLWFGHVEYYLLKKNEPEFFNDKVVKYGYFRGSQTANYVIKTLETYERYKKKVKQ